METILEKLQQNNIQPSFQRIKILEILDRKREHMNVNLIYEELIKEIPTISKTTIYNALKTFVEKGIVQCLTITPEEVRYDLETTPHHHLLCKRCGRIIDVNVCCIYTETMEINGH
nr:transcriptional repressor [Syntrophorhabdaceae bacterium]